MATVFVIFSEKKSFVFFENEFEKATKFFRKLAKKNEIKKQAGAYAGINDWFFANKNSKNYYFTEVFRFKNPISKKDFLENDPIFGNKN